MHHTTQATSAAHADPLGTPRHQVISSLNALLAAARHLALAASAPSETELNAAIDAEEAALRAQAGQASPPAIGEYWPGQGGIYAGITRGRDGQGDHHLILAADDTSGMLNWEAACAWAKAITADGHTDFSLPERFESALLYANLQDKLDASSWHWTGTQSSAYYAYLQTFSDGGQYNGGKGYKGRARAVRRLPVNPSVL